MTFYASPPVNVPEKDLKVLEKDLLSVQISWRTISNLGQLFSFQDPSKEPFSGCGSPLRKLLRPENSRRKLLRTENSRRNLPRPENSRGKLLRPLNLGERTFPALFSGFSDSNFLFMMPCSLLRLRISLPKASPTESSHGEGFSDQHISEKDISRSVPGILRIE